MKRTINYLTCLVVLLGLTPMVPAAAQGTGWQADLKKVAIPGRPAAGRIHGKPFRVERAELGSGNILSLRQGKEFFADREFKIFLFAPGEKLDGRTFEVGASSKAGQMNPHIHMSWMERKDGVPRSEILFDKYSMRLQFGKRKNGKITGQLYLCMPDAQKSYVAGYFSAALKDTGGATTGTVNANATQEGNTTATSTSGSPGGENLANSAAGPVALLLSLFMLALSLATLVGLWKLFQKTGKPGWASLIPIYNTVVLLEIAGRPVWWLVLLLVPVVNLIAGIVVCSDLARKFGRGPGFAAGLVLLPFVFYPVLGLGSSRYEPAG